MWSYGKNNKVLILDMDGTIADLYGHPDWAGILRGHPQDPWTQCGEPDAQEIYNMFINLEPLIDSQKLLEFSKRFDDVLVWSMAPWDASQMVCNATYQAKKFWLDKHFGWIPNILVTRFNKSKSLVIEEDVLLRNYWSLPMYWSPTPFDTLIDDNEEVLDNFIGQGYLPPWI